MSTVSAIVSAYFAKDYLNNRIINLFGAKGVDVEPIVVCQAGSDEDMIASRYDVKVIRTLDIPTVGKAWNMGIRESTGDYITTANSDDRYLIGGLKRMVEVLDEHEEIGLVFAQVDIDDGHEVVPWKRIDNKTGEIEDILAVLKRRCIVGPMPIWRKSIHDEVGLFDEKFVVASDYDMWLRMAGEGVRFYYINESCGVYMKRWNSLEHRHPIETRTESQEIRKVWA